MSLTSLLKRAKTTQVTLRKKEINDRTIIAFIEYVQSSVLSLRKQMSFLSPSLGMFENNEIILIFKCS